MDKVKIMGGPPVGSGWGGQGGNGETFGKAEEGGRISRDEMFLEMAGIVAKRSTCQRSKVGALIVRGGRPISCGYNGPVSGAPECKDIGGCLGAGCDRSIHAELNSILFAAKAGISVDGCTLYCTLSPCIKCAQAIVNSGIKRMVYQEKYRDQSGLEFLVRNMVQVERIKKPETVKRWISLAPGYKCPVCGHRVADEVAECGNGVCPYCLSMVE